MDSLTWSRRFGDMVEGPRDMAADVAAEQVRSALFGATPQPRFGRYRTLRELGRGGQGVVFAAVDPVLDRPVALKIVEAGEPSQIRRVLREAQLLARASHPNIATIFDVGVARGHVYLAMELVAGRNLAAWLVAERPGPDAILAIMLQVAGALAFAHATGVVHCDVKPHNVLVGDDGRVRMVDFGLARLHRTAAVVELDTTVPIPVMSGSVDDGPGDDVSMPAGGGTPAYAAPEIWRNEPPDAAADQFSYCVMLYEALVGRRPFGSAPGRRLALDPTDPLVFPDTPRLPRWLRALLRRGLAAEAAARHPGMDVLARLLIHPRRSRRRIAGLVAGGVLTAVGLAVAPGEVGEPTAPPCHDHAPQAAIHQDDAMRARIDERLAGFDPELAAGTRQRLDAYAAELVRLRGEACALEPEPARERLRCLDDLALAHGVALEHLAQGGARTPAALASVLDGLEGTEACLPRAAAHEDPEAAALLAEAHLLAHSGRSQQAYATALLGCGRLQRRDDAQWARCRTELGTALSLEGRTAEAEVLLQEGFDLASGLGDDAIAIVAVERLATIALDRRAEADARRWVGYLHASADRLGQPDVAFLATLTEAQMHATFERYDQALTLLDELANSPRAAAYSAGQRVALEVRLAVLRGRLGDSEGSHRHFARGLALVDRLTPGDPVVGDLHSMRAQQLGLDGRYEESLAAYRVALAHGERDLGPDSATSVRARDGIADALMRLDRLDEALAIADANVARTMTRDDPEEHADALITRANAYIRSGRPAEARRDALAALTVAESEFGAASATRNARMTYASALLDLGELEAARVVERQVLAESIALFGEDHPETMAAVIGLAEVTRALGDYAGAVALHRRARDGFAAVYGQEHPGVAIGHYNLGECLLLAGDPTAALPEAERALAIWTALFGEAHQDTRDAAALVARIRGATGRRGAPPG